ncbi:MAG TPA: hypothetical protein VKT72_03870 [Candidatus Baltobacteraceae bacterium]|nr:hypothetical protein [Candidatus Baltobacteraceae bacterium]
MNMLKSLHRPIAAVTLVALAACGNNAAGQGPLGPTPPPAPSSGGTYSTKIVGIGDSLTAGTQSGTTMGALSSNPFSPLPGGVVPPTQENGWFALFFAQANSIALDPAKYNLDTALGIPQVSPLPLIAAPGLGAQLLFSASLPTGPGLFETHLDCDSFDNSAYTLGALSSVRLNPLTKTYDLGVPGITMHEALAMTAPLTGAPPGPNANGQCPGYPTIAGDVTSGNLQTVVQSASQAFYPVLGSYTKNVTPLTELSVALSLKPSVATVWLGANDLLEYIFSNETSPTTDPPAQFQQDLTTIVTSLEKAGAKVLLADLPNVLQTPQFFQGGVPANLAAPSQSVYYYLQVLSNGAVSAAEAQQIVGAIAAPEPNGCGVDAGGYLTESGMEGLLTFLATPANLALLGKECPLDINSTGVYTQNSGIGTLYLNAKLATDAATLNAGYNQIIDGLAAKTGATLVPITATFSAVYAASNTAPYYYFLHGASDPVSLRFGGHLIGFDGLHPSDTGYAVIANTFIASAAAAGINVTPLSDATLDAIYAYDPYYIPNPLAPGFPLLRRR